LGAVAPLVLFCRAEAFLVEGTKPVGPAPEALKVLAMDRPRRLA